MLLCLLTARPATSAPAGEPAAAVDLYLEVILNQQPTGAIANFKQEPDGTLLVAPGELSDIGIVVREGDTDANGLVALGRLAGVSFSFDSAAQVISISAPPDRLVPHVFDARSRDAGKAADGTPLSGLALNYTFYGSTGTDGSATASALLDAWLFSPKGILSQSGLLRTGNGWRSQTVRLDTTWTISRPQSLLNYAAGDLITGGLAWTRPVRLGGLQIRRNFALRPDLVTAPLPSFSGTAAVPSTVDVYANGARVYSNEIPAGPFTISDLPLVSGAGTARVVLRDSLGRATETNLPFLASPLLLRKDLTDFSLEAGVPRRSYGVESFDYALAVPALSATLRRGMSDRLTLEAHGEATPELLNGGLGVVTAVGHRGLLSAALAGSLGAHAGLQASLGAEWHIAAATLRLRTTRSIAAYADIAAVSATTGYDSAASRAVDQASLSFPLPGRDSSLAAAIAHTEGGAQVGTVASLTYNRRIGTAASLYATAYYASRDRGAGFFVGLSRSLDDGITASAQVAGSAAAPSGRVELAKSEKSTPGSVGWRLAGDFGDAGTTWLASASLRGTRARFAGNLTGSGNSVAATGEVRGALVAVDGDIFMADRIDNSFAVVDAGAPNVTVYAENKPVGRTDANGKLLVPRLRAWQANTIAIEPDDLAADETVDKTAATVRPDGHGGVAVDFGVHSTKDNALVVIRRLDGRFPPAGTQGRLNGKTAFVVGYDGEAYLENLAAENRFDLALPAGQCSGAFAFRPDGTAQPRVGGVVCQ